MSKQPSRTTAENSSATSPFEAALKTYASTMDPFGILSSQLKAQLAWAQHPQELWRFASSLSADLLKIYGHGARRMLGLSEVDPEPRNPEDERFADAAWSDWPAWDLLKEHYLLLTHRLQDAVAQSPDLSDHERQVADFWQRVGLNMLAPTNFFWLNPQAIQRFFKTRGQSAVTGWSNFVRDMEAQNILMVEPDAFVVGKDLGTTPGKVVHRNRLVELIHYTPTTDKVRAMPIVIVTPWINKYYILDLTAQKSMVKHLTDQGFSVFITSWKNPDADMRDVRLDDYLLQGVDEVVRTVTDLCKVPQVHLVGYCIGGTLVSTYMAWANRHFGSAKMPVAHWTLFATLTDFSHPGEIEVFIDEESISALEGLMSKKGYLDGNEMAASFRLLRANSLIWNYWVSSYLLGEDLPKFDVLFWNMDATRMPQAMHSYYLRQMYLHNRLVEPDALTIADEPINLGRITQPLYAVTARDDHIAPWTSCYQIRRVVHPDTPVRFVLSTSGHILGIVNPPVDPPKRSFWIGEPTAEQSAQDWLAQAPKTPGSWWGDWTTWLHGRTGEMVPAYGAGRRKFGALADAPGTYVLEK